MFSRSLLNASLQEIAVGRSLDRREFLRGGGRGFLGGAVSGFGPWRAMEANAHARSLTSLDELSIYIARS